MLGARRLHRHATTISSGSASRKQRPLPIGGQRIARVFVATERRRNGPVRQRVDERHDLARTGRSTLVRAAAVGILDLAVALFARAGDDRLAGGGKADGEVGQGALELGENGAPQINVAGILRCQVNGDGQRLAQFSERALICDRKRVAPILAHVEREPDLRRRGA
jgi:hypothetical protein